MKILSKKRQKHVAASIVEIQRLITAGEDIKPEHFMAITELLTDIAGELLDLDLLIAVKDAVC